MGFKSLFKVRKPGNGGAFQKKVEAAGKTLPNVGMQKNNFLSKDKKSV